MNQLLKPQCLITQPLHFEVPFHLCSRVQHLSLDWDLSLSNWDWLMYPAIIGADSWSLSSLKPTPIFKTTIELKSKDTSIPETQTT